MRLQSSDDVCVTAQAGRFRIESSAHDGNRTVVTMNRSELAALYGALGELIKFYSIND